MDKDLKMFLGKILGEIYKLQLNVTPQKCSVEKETIHGLLNGFEPIIDQELEQVGYISSEQFNHVVNVLHAYQDPNKIADFKGFYTIEHELHDGGVGRGEASKILKLLKAYERFPELMHKINTGDSPIEFKHWKEDDLLDV